MEDRFKFRFYDKKCKIMIYDLLIQLTSRPKSLDSILNEDNEYISVMQCTGLKDKNGKLIYEKDILKQSDGIIDVIQWFQGCYIHNGVGVADYLPLYQGEIWATDSKSLEIIGNIYENKDLLDASI